MDKISLKVLKLLYRRERCTYVEISKITGHDEAETPSKNISFLYSKKFILNWYSGELIDINGIKEDKAIGYEINLDGIAYIQERNRSLLNFWVPYAITTFIALLSLVASLADNWGTILLWLCHRPG